MFEEEAKEYRSHNTNYYEWDDFCADDGEAIEEAYQQGATDSYNKANEWQYPSKGELPKISGKYLVFTGGEPFMLDYDTETKDFGYWCLDVGDNFGIRDTIFKTITELDEDKVIAWKEVVLPKEVKE